MISSKIKKSSMLTLALVAVISAALFFCLLPVAGNVYADTLPAGLSYVDNGTQAYLAITYDLDFDGKAEMKSGLEQVAADADDYHTALGNYTENADLTVSFETLGKYAALVSSVEEYNAMVGQYGKDDTYLVSVPGTYAYAAGEKETDVTASVAAKALADIRATAAGWEDASEYNYDVKYTVTMNGQNVFVIYASRSGEPLIIAADAVELIENKATNGAVDLFFTAGTDVVYNVVASIKTKYEVNVDKTFAVYDVSLISAKEGDVATDKFSVVKAEGDVSVMTVGELEASAADWFAEPVLSEIEDKHTEYVTLIANKINTVKSAAADKLSDAEKEYDADLYTDEKAAEVAGIFADAKAAAATAASYSDIPVFSEVIANANAVETIPQTFAGTYGNIIINDKIYNAAEYNAAVAAVAEYDAFTKAAVKTALADSAATIKKNITNTAVNEIKTVAEQKAASGDYSPNQIREIAKESQRALNAIDAAGYDMAAILAARGAFDDFITSTADNYATNPEGKLTDGNVTVTVEGGKFDSRATLSATTAEAAEEDETLTESKKTDSVARKLSAIESFGITVNIDGTAVLTESDGATKYNVSVKLSDGTLEKIKAQKVDIATFLVAYVDAGGRIETYETTLQFVMEDNSVVTYEGKSVEWDKIAEGHIMFTTMHFSTYYLMGNTSNLALSRLTGLLAGFVESETLKYLLIGLAALVGVILLFIIIAYFCSVGTVYKIKFRTNGGKRVKTIHRKYGRKLPELVSSEKDGYVFGGWCIDKTLKYEFNRSVMPRANVVLYARWLEPVSEMAEAPVDGNAALVSYYDRLRAKLASYRKEVAEGEKSYVEKIVLAKLFAENGEVKLQAKTGLNYINEKDGKAYIVPEEEKFEQVAVTDDASFDEAVSLIEKMADVNELVRSGENTELAPSSYEDISNVYEYSVTYEAVADYAERYAALRAYAASFTVADEAKAEEGKLVYEQIPAENDTLNLGFALDAEKYSAILTVKDGGELKNTYAVTEGENVFVALELISRVMEENGLAVAENTETDAASFDVTETYRYVIAAKEETAKEFVLADAFRQFRLYVTSFALYENGNTDRAHNGKMVVKAQLFEDKVAAELDPEGNCEDISFACAEEFTAAKEKVAAFMESYGFESEGADEDKELVDADRFCYRIKFPEPLSAKELLGEIRNMVKGYAMFAEEGVEPDKSHDGVVVVKAVISEDEVKVTVDPDAEAQEFVVKNENDLKPVEEAVAVTMAKYGFEPDPDYAPDGEQPEGDSFGYRIKF